MTTEPAFLFPEPELVETISAGLEAHKRREQERAAKQQEGHSPHCGWCGREP